VEGYVVTLYLAADPEHMADEVACTPDQWIIEDVFDPMCDGVQIVRAWAEALDLGAEPACTCGGRAVEAEHLLECVVLHSERWAAPKPGRPVWPNAAKPTEPCSDGCLGWDVFEREPGVLAIEKCDACGRFESDADACWYIVNTVIAAGSKKRLPGSLVDTSPGHLLRSLGGMAKQLERGER